MVTLDRTGLSCGCSGFAFKKTCQHVGAVAIYTDRNGARAKAEQAFAELEAFLVTAHAFRLAAAS